MNKIVHSSDSKNVLELYSMSMQKARNPLIYKGFRAFVSQAGLAGFITLAAGLPLLNKLDQKHTSCYPEYKMKTAVCEGLPNEILTQTILTLPFVRRKTMSMEATVVTERIVARAAAVPSLMRTTSW